MAQAHKGGMKLQKKIAIKLVDAGGIDSNWNSEESCLIQARKARSATHEVDYAEHSTIRQH